MSRDLPGQALLFPELREQTGHEPIRDGGVERAPAFGLPPKATCTVGEASRHTGISVRQLRYWVEDGTLFAVNAARRPAGSAGGGPCNKLDRWRIVVRRTPEFAAEGANFMTLEEFLRARTNKES